MPEEYAARHARSAENVGGSSRHDRNIDDNFGAMLAKLKEWGDRGEHAGHYLGTDNGGTRV